MGDLVLNPGLVLRGAERWRDAAELLQNTSSLLAGETMDGLSRRVRPAGAAFLSAWTGYANEGATIAEQYSDGLEAVVEDIGRTDDEAEQLFEAIDPLVGAER